MRAGSAFISAQGCQWAQTVVPRTGNPDVKFAHCLAATHNRDTGLGEGGGRP